MGPLAHGFYFSDWFEITRGWRIGYIDACKNMAYMLAGDTGSCYYLLFSGCYFTHVNNFLFLARKAVHGSLASYNGFLLISSLSLTISSTTNLAGKEKKKDLEDSFKEGRKKKKKRKS